MPIHEALLSQVRTAVAAADTLYLHAKNGVRAAVKAAGGIDNAQHEAHGLAWLWTYVEALRQMLRWAERLSGEGRFGELERLILQAGAAEYANQIAFGIPMSQSEIVRPVDFGVSGDDIVAFIKAGAGPLQAGLNPGVKARIAALIAEHPNAVTFGELGLDDEMNLVRDQFRKFVVDRVAPHAHQWHLKDELIPMPVVEAMSALGVKS